MGESPNAEKWAVARPRAPSPRRAAAQPGRLLLRGHGVPGSSRRPGSCTSSTPGSTDGREPVGPRPVPQLEVLIAHIDPARRPDGVRLRRHLAGAADAREAGRGLRPRVPDRARSRATSTCSTAWPRASRTRRRRPWPRGCAAFGHTNQEEWWTLLWRDAALDGGADVAPSRSRTTSRTPAWSSTGRRGTPTATAVALQGRPARGPSRDDADRAGARVAPEQRPRASRRRRASSSGRSGRYLTGDTGYAGQPQARHHNTITVGGQGQGDEGDHDVWPKMDSGRARHHPHHGDAGRRRRACAIEADAAGAYLPSAGLVRFHRTFQFDGKDGFVVEDAIETQQAEAHPVVPARGRARSRRGAGRSCLAAPSPSLLATIALAGRRAGPASTRPG